ncbi:FAD/NAD(P)-binding protein [Glycomyces harbinensis]|uniref:NAD(P)H-flavin reductase n=1 Tax=Glycomyces harbinensis TaxID=58114 RepID=A0A1G6XM61_9ACTN|nr:FAD/NAD(P)-binding protein [Glycomyces harbinensis]SDD79260.1 NAD(P)H-flavin reductase [Glycomyces harbinensis]
MIPAALDPKRTVRATAMAPVPYTVFDHRRETRDTVTLTLLPSGREAVPPFAPGQFTMLSVAGIGEIPVSVSGDADRRDGRIVQTIRAVGAVSAALCGAEAGRRIGVRGPFGKGWCLPAAGGDLLVVAGGIGLAPLRPLVLAALARRDRFRGFHLLVGARTHADLLYPYLIDAWARRGDMTVAATLDRPADTWDGRVGLITGPLEETAIAPERTTAFLCGPEIMIRVCAGALVERGVPAESIQVSLERNMQCGVGWCGHCQLGPYLLCRQGPVRRWDHVADLLDVEEL